MEKCKCGGAFYEMEEPPDEVNLYYQCDKCGKVQNLGCDVPIIHRRK